MHVYVVLVLVRCLLRDNLLDCDQNTIVILMLLFDYFGFFCTH